MHVCRNPWLVHASTVKLMRSFTENLAFQTTDPAAIEDFVSLRYQLIMEKWFADRNLIPRENLIELRHEDIIASPIQLVETIYRRFGLTAWSMMQPRLKAYADSLIGYQNNAYVFEEGHLSRIEPHLAHIARELGYSRP